MSEEKDEIERTRRAQLLTCRCCKIGWPTPLRIREHLLEVVKGVAANLAELDRAKL